MLGFATPVFIFAIIMLFVFGFGLDWFPTGGSVSPKVEEGTLAYALSNSSHMILPAIQHSIDFNDSYYSIFTK